MAKRKKNHSARPAAQAAPRKKSSGLKWWLIAAAAVFVVAAVVVGVILLTGKDGGPEDPGYQGISPTVDASGATTMRIVKAGTAYLTPDTASGTVFSFRRGDRVEVVAMDANWVTISVQGRGYYLPREMVRGLEEYVIVLDAGHQLREDIGKEAIGPGGAETEKKMDVGGVGVVTEQAEYDMTLAVCLQLKATLESRGYTVYLTRNHNGANISYKDRAMVANNLNADAYLTLHSGHSTDPEARGVGAVCQTEKNPYISDLYTENKKLCQTILDAMAKSTENKKLELRQTDKLSGINWCRTPMAMLEMGYLSNENDDRLLSSDQYRQKLVEGIADGLDAYFTAEDKK